MMNVMSSMLILDVKTLKFNVNSVENMTSQIEKVSLITALMYLKKLYNNLEEKKSNFKNDLNQKV